MVDRLAEDGYVESIYQVGGCRHPGISDIDLLLVVDDNASSADDPLLKLPPHERYLFTHSCFLVPSLAAQDFANYIQFDECRRIYGAATPWEASIASPSAASALSIQTAVEFLAKNYIDLYVQLTYGMLKVRVFLQHLKGLMSDFQALGIHESGADELSETAGELTDDWFEISDAELRVDLVAARALGIMRLALESALERHQLFAPSLGRVVYSDNISFEPAATIGAHHTGSRLPHIQWLAGRRYFNAHHRLNRFVFQFPMGIAAPDSYHASRFDFLRRVKSFAATNFPGYSAPIPPLFYRAL